jgi:Flp pilus assembly protein TadG
MKVRRIIGSHVSRKQSGVSAVEFAFVLIPLLLIVFGITEFGRAIYQYNTLTKSARAASRLLTTDDYRKDTFVDAAMCLAVHARTDCSGSPVIAGLKLTNVVVEVPVDGAPASTLNVVTVTIEGFKFDSLMPWVLGSIEFSPIRASMPVIPF